MSLKLGNTNIAGTQVLYSTTGNNTDGAMTQNATTTQLNLKANDIDVVHKTGDEIIGGIKILYSQDGVNLRLKSNYIDDDHTPSTSQYSNFLDNLDINNKLLSRIYTTKSPNGANGIALQAWKGSTNYALSVFTDGTTIAPPSDAINSIVTTINKSKAENGYFQLGNGLIIQWGTSGTLNECSSLTITLPKAFTSTNYSVTANFKVQHTAQDAEGVITVDNFTTTTFRLSAGYLDPNSGTVSWIAIGY